VTEGKRILAGYELLERLGRGSMGAVFLARQVSLDRMVAIKVLSPRLSKNQDYVRRFLREAQAAARLNHTNIISAIDVGDTGKYKYFVMEYAEGPTVADLLQRGGAMDEKRAVTILLQVAGALAHANQSGFVHRDVKPANIILTPSGTAKLCDLGLAKEVEEEGGDTQEGQTMGTPDYISPEQARGDIDIDIRTDIYSLGATLYHMVTGEVPFKGPNPAVVMTKHLTEAIPDPREANPAVSPQMSQLIRRMLAKQRAERPQTPEALIADLKAIKDGTARRPIPVLKSRRRRRRR
jgi:eukaryotic-like serine/threonine-protein kinase